MITTNFYKVRSIFYASILTLIGMTYESKKNAHL